jgi:hypothetical protein
MIANPFMKDYEVRQLAEAILEKRGWTMRYNYDGLAFLGPLGYQRELPRYSTEVNQIEESSSFSELIARNVVAPLKAKALSVAKQLVDGYRLILEAETPTSTHVTVTLPEKIDYNVFAEVEKVLAPRGWAVSHSAGSAYSVWPTEKSDRPYRGSMLL